MKYFPICFAILVSIFALFQQLPSLASAGHPQQHAIHGDTTKPVQKMDSSKIALRENAAIAIPATVDFTQLIIDQEAYYKEKKLNLYLILLILVIDYVVLALVVVRVRSRGTARKNDRTRISFTQDLPAEEYLEELFYEQRKRMRNIWHTIIFISLGVLLTGASIWIMNAPDRILEMGDEYHKSSNIQVSLVIPTVD